MKMSAFLLLTLQLTEVYGASDKPKRHYGQSGETYRDNGFFKESTRSPINLASNFLRNMLCAAQETAKSRKGVFHMVGKKDRIKIVNSTGRRATLAIKPPGNNRYGVPVKSVQYAKNKR